MAADVVASFAQCSAAVVLLAAAVMLAAAAYAYYATYHHGRWKKLGVPHAEPTLPFGNFGDTVAGRAHPKDLLHALYRRHRRHRYFGVYVGRDPALVLRDPELAHAVMVRDFAHFCDRVAGKTSFRHDQLYDHLINLRGAQWKAVRAKLSPTFTAAKLKAMMGDMNACTARLVDNLYEQVASKNGIVDVSEASAQFTTDTIGRCAFGLECNSISDPHSEFRRVGRDVLTPSPRSALLSLIRLVGLGWVLDVFRVRGMPDHIYDFFNGILKATMELHETEENKRNDFIALLVKIKADEKQNKEKLFTDDILAANAFAFFIAGFETTASTISYCLYELAMNPEVQMKLRDKIKETLNANEGKLAYDTLKDLAYMDMVINETMRLHPPVPAINRVCTKMYTIPESNITLNIGEKLIIPTYAFHHDSKYYPNPEIFDPERFSEDNKTTRPNGTFLPFGDGPRICIGLRFAMIEVKTGLAEILSKFEISPCDETQSPIKINPRSILLTPKESIRLSFKKLV